MGNKVDLVEVLASAVGEIRGLLGSMAQGPEWDRVQVVRGFVEDAAAGVDEFETAVFIAEKKREELELAVEFSNGVVAKQIRRAEDAEAREEKCKSKILDLENAAVLDADEKSKLSARVKDLEDAAKVKKD